MPIEIKELVIKVTVNDDQSGNRQSAADRRQGGRQPSGSAKERTAIVAECVEQILQILQAKTER